MPLPISYYKKIRVGAATPADYARSGCLEPKQLWVVDSEIGEQRRIWVDCGHCFNCLNQRRKEWVSRMILHSHYYQHCYFVTLTYGSYNLAGFEQHPFKEDWLQTFPVLDCHNSSGRPRWTPSILRHEHLTKFFKRLRKNHYSAPISYVGCGELGDKYGRPHFHVLLWSNLALSAQDIADAWSYKCVKLDHDKIVVDNGKYGKEYQHFNFRIGHIDMVDLVANGSLDPHKSARDVNDHRTAKYCFAYVAKYIGKQDALTMFEHDGSRHTNQYAYERYKKAFELLPYSWKQEIWKPTQSCFRYYDTEGNKKYFYTDTKVRTVEDFIFNQEAVPPVSIYTHDFTYNSQTYENVDFYKFASIAGPFFVCSRGYAIGKQYALENLSRFTKGDFNLPDFQSKSLVFPSYFLQMAERKIVPIRFDKVTLKGTSLNKGSYPRVLDFFTQLREDRNITLALGNFNLYSCPFLDAARVEGEVNVHNFERPPYMTAEMCRAMSPKEREQRYRRYQELQSLGSIDGKNLIPGNMLDITFTYPEIGLVHYRYNYYNDTFDGFRFESSHRKYFPFECVDRIDFCDRVLDCINLRLSTLPQRQQVQQMKLDLIDMVEADPRTQQERELYLTERKLAQDNYSTNHFDPL